MRGRDVNRYSESWGGEYLVFDKPMMWSNTDEKLLRAMPKILIRQTGDSIIAAIENEGKLIIDSLYLFDPSNGYDPRYILALLNSKLLSTLYSFYTPEQDRAFAQVKIVNLKPLPIRKVEFSITGASTNSLIKIAQDLSFQEDQQTLLKQCDELLESNRTDTIHDLLAYLAEQMIAMHREKQSLTVDFWTDLEGVCDPAVFRKLRDKGKQEAGLAAELETEFLPRNSVSKRTRTLDESLAWDEAAFKGFVRALAGRVERLSGLVKVYHTHAPRYRELTERIDRTDWLIDQIVYQLYGLTDEEIAIVEGRAA